MITNLWLQPPLAFARLGDPEEPLESFHWGPNDDVPGGTGKTTILPAKTYIVQPDGTLQSIVPNRIVFASKDRMKAVCPFFELHGRWIDEEAKEHDGAITKDILAAAGRNIEDLVWHIKVANLKPLFMTQDATTRIDAEIEVRGNDFNPKELRGTSPAGMENVLVPEGTHIPLGTVRVIKPTVQEPECRLRFLPPRGEVYGPTDFASRANKEFQLRESVLFLNKNSKWCRFTDTSRGLPGGQFARDANGVSLGLVDDTSDGIISCRIDGTDLAASARIVVAPPHLAPDRRHFVSIADGLKDRVQRVEVHSNDYFSKEGTTYRFNVDHEGTVGKEAISNQEMASIELLDLLERVLETMWLSNLDVYNHRIEVVDNPINAVFTRQPYSPSQHVVFKTNPTPHEPLPLVDNARREHRRLSAFQILQTSLRQNPGELHKLIRLPLDPSLLYDTRMPVLMHGSYGEPLSLTRRQFDLLATLVARFRDKKKEGS